MDISEKQNSLLTGDTAGEALKQIYAGLSEVLSISQLDISRIHEYYIEARKTDEKTRTQMIIYAIVSQIRKENPSFPIELKRVYLISTAFSQAGLTVKKKPNQYRSKSTGKIKYTAQQVMTIIENKQDRFLRSVTRHGLHKGYAVFAHKINGELHKENIGAELPIDWKWISKNVGDGTGKNAFSGGAISLLKLRPSVRKRLNRVVQGQPLYPKKREILACSVFLGYLSAFLQNRQSSSKGKGGFHAVLTAAIRTWNNHPEFSDLYFTLPTVLYPNPRQESLGSILGLSSFGASDFLQGLSLPDAVWKIGYDANTVKMRFSSFILQETGVKLAINDFDIVHGVIQWKLGVFDRYPKLDTPDTVQGLYEKFSLQYS